MSYDKVKPATYNPSKKTLDIIEETYNDIEVMVENSEQGYAEFNQNGEGKDRTLREFVDDCQKRANSYTPTREAQGKESWQANVFTPTTRNKVKALIAGVAKQPPEIALIAKNDKNQESIDRAEKLKILVDSSFVEGDKNPEVDMFYEAWNAGIQGTVIELEDYIRIKDKVKRITNYDPATGEVEYEEVEAYVKDEAEAIRIPLTSFFIWNIYCPDVQKQPKIAMVNYLDKSEVERQYGDFANYKYTVNGSYHFNEEDTKTFFLKQWENRTKAHGKPYEVVRYYCKSSDTYRIIINGVLILDAPMLWGSTKKRYPFAKSIYEPFANADFFWGNSLVNILMAEQDVENALLNSMTDKTYRSLNRPMLIGRVNRDNFDLEDEWVDGDTKIYVEDVSQAMPMPVDGVNNAEISMLKIIQGGLEQDSTDAVQSGASGSGSTAREIVIANERAEELKGLFFLFIKDLWLQKYRLRTINILMNYGTPRILESIDGEGVVEYYRTFRLPSAELSNGKPGTLEIQVVKSQKELKRPYDLDLEEEKARMQGQPKEVIQMTSTHLDGYDFDVIMLTNSMYQKSRALKMAEGQEEIMGVAKLFPQKFMANEQRFFDKYIEMYGDNPDLYDAPEQQQGMPEGMPPELAGAMSNLPPTNQEVPQLGALPSV